MKTTIKLFLIDGDPQGRIKCSFSSGWNGCGYKIPASDISKCDDIALLRQAGVYFLFGYDEKDNDVVYIGQGKIRQNGQGVLCRIKEPHNQIPNWNTCVVFVSNDSSNIGPTELNYLENKFTTLAQQARRYIVKNGNTPNSAKLSEEDQADMESFLSNTSIILNTLGYKVLEPVISKKFKKDTIDDYFIYKFGDKEARGIMTDEGFVLLAGSQLVDEQNCAKRWIEKLPLLRSKHCDKIKNNITIADIQFRSSSGAANFCSGQSVSGPKCWIDKNGLSIEQRINKNANNS